MDPRERLQHVLQLRFGLPPGRPTDSELDKICRAVPILERKFGQLNDDGWRTVTLFFVRFEGKWAYHGQDFSDLNALLLAIRLQASSSRRR